MVELTPELLLLTALIGLFGRLIPQVLIVGFVFFFSVSKFLVFAVRIFLHIALIFGRIIAALP